MGESKDWFEAQIVFTKKEGSNSILNFVELVGSAILLIIAFTLLTHSAKKNQGVIKFLFILEIVLFILVAVGGFLVPFVAHLVKGNAINYDATNLTGFWFGLLLFFHGFNVLYSCSYTKQDRPFWFFLIGVLFLSLGVFLMVSGLGLNIGKIINWCIISLFLLFGIFLLILWIVGLKKKDNTNISINNKQKDSAPKELETKTLPEPDKTALDKTNETN
jgi:hypothetical protein